MTATLEHDLAGDTPPLWLTRLAALAAPPVLALAWLASGGAFTADGDVAYKPSREAVRLANVAAHEPEVVVVGNSQANVSVLPDLLQRRLHTDAPPLMLTIPSSNLVALVPLLQTLVFDPGHTPSVVVVPMSWTHLRQTDRPGVRVLEDFAPELALPHPAVDAKLHGTLIADTPWDKARATWMQRRQSLLDDIAHAPGRMVPGDADERMERAASHVLGDQGDMDRRTARMIPVVEAGRSATSGAAAGALDATLVPELVDLVRSHGADLVVVGLPQARNDMAATAADERAWAEWLRERGVAYVDLTTLDIPPDGWIDRGHMSKESAVLFTNALAEQLTDLDALAPGFLTPPPPLLDPEKVRRKGKMPAVDLVQVQPSKHPCELVAYMAPWLTGLSDKALEDMGLGLASPLRLTYDGEPLTPHVLPEGARDCDGSFAQTNHRAFVRTQAPHPDPDRLQAHWANEVPIPGRRKRGDVAESQDLYLVAPGTALGWADPDAHELAEGAVVRMVLTELIPGALGPEVRISGLPLPIARSGLNWVASDTVEVTGPLRAVVSSPPNGPWLAVRGLVVEEGDQEAWWVGLPDTLGDHVDLAGVQGTVTKAPKEPPRIRGEVTVHDGRARVRAQPREQAISGARVREGVAANKPYKCQQLKLVSSVARPITLSDFDEEGITEVALPKGTDDADWHLALSNDRTCQTWVWVYPTETVAFVPRFPHTLTAAGTHLVLRMYGFPAEDAVHARVRLVTRDGPVLERLVTITPDDDTIELPLDTPLPAQPDGLQLEIGLQRGDGYLLVRHAEVVAR